MRTKLLPIYILSLLVFITPLYALDTEIFVESMSAPPNIVFLLDTSATMKNADLLAHTVAYDSSGIYTPTKIGSITPQKGTIYYSKNVFKETEKMLLVEVTSNISKITCSEAQKALSSAGVYIGNLSTTPNSLGEYGCSSSESRAFYNGNYLNYLCATDIPGDTVQLRQKVARDTIKFVVGNTADTLVRFGLMGFESIKDDGGNIVLGVGSTDAQFATLLDNSSTSSPIDSRGTTPLAEALAEAGLYYAGKPRWSNYQSIYDSTILSGSTYISPIQYRCQKNYVVIITDGMSTNDIGVPSGGNNGAGYNLFTSNQYINNKRIIDYVGFGDDDDENIDLVDVDGDGTVDDVVREVNTEHGTHMLDEVAALLANEDFKTSGTDLGGGSYESSDPDEDLQNVVTFTVGFMTGSGTSTLSEIDQLLSHTAAKGNGEFYSANDAASLKLALIDIVDKIMEANSSFVAPVVPVNKLNKVYSGNSVYLSLFKPVDDSAFWLGNIKKFGITTNAVLLQKNGTRAADNNDVILDSAFSCWQRYAALDTTAASDGSETNVGGAGEVILHQSNRTFYTNPSSSGALIDFYSDTSIRSELGVAADKQQDLIDYLTAKGDYAFGVPDTGRKWVLGDILHSKPATMFVGNETVIFLGANDGFLHALVDDDKGTRGDTLGTTAFSDDTLSEAWSFVPRSLLPQLHYLKETNIHDHFYVDGSPVIYDAGATRYLTFGLRRGGESYYTLNLGSLVDGEYTGGYANPTFAGEIGPNVLGGKEPLGQSWGRPLVSTIATSATEWKKVLILSGGYDDVNEDKPAPTANTKGRAVFAYDPVAKTVLSTLNFNNTDNPMITHSIVELIGFDYNSDGVDDTIYAGSMGGELFGFQDRNEDGTWIPRKVFQAGDGTASTSYLKFFYEPDVALERFGDYVYIGSGDREHPTETGTVNRFYAIKNEWNASAFTTLTETNLVDVTNLNNDQYTTTVLGNLDTNKGWFIKLSTGEKVMSSPLLFDRKVFFTTYTPSVPVSGIDLCGTKSLGKGKLYALDYLTGKSVMNFNTGNDTTNADGTTTEVLDKTDRSTELGMGIPSAPTLIVMKDGGTKLIIAIGVAESGDSSDDNENKGGDIKTKILDVKSGSSSDLFYWRQN